jgi:hypothetical protein
MRPSRRQWCSNGLVGGKSHEHEVGSGGRVVGLVGGELGHAPVV